MSIIVPVWNDDALLGSMLAGTGAADPVVEWIIAAVNPGPILEQLADDKHILLVCCPAPSRGAQMNLGAARARGRLLCFHHADTIMTPDHLRSLFNVADDPEIVGGAFHRRFDNRHPWMLCWENIVQRFDRGLGPFFGDQSLFIRAEKFRAMGGFADIPFMEDIEFCRRLKKEGPVTLLHPPICSSPRRFQRLGSWRTSALNAIFIAMYYAGISPHRLHRWYYGYRHSPGVATSRAE